MAEATKLEVVVKKEVESDRAELLSKEGRGDDVVIGLPSSDDALWGSTKEVDMGGLKEKGMDTMEKHVKVQAGPVSYWVLHASSLPLFAMIYCGIMFVLWSCLIRSTMSLVVAFFCILCALMLYGVILFVLICKWDKRHRLIRFKLTSLEECNLKEEGSVVRVEGMVLGAPHVPLLTSYYQRLSGCVFTELRVRRPNYVELHRTKSVHFVVTDPNTGASVLVKAGANQPGKVVNWNDLTERTNLNLFSKILWKLKLTDGPDIHVSENCVREGDHVTVVGKLATESQGRRAIVPLTNNVVMRSGTSKALLAGYYHGLIIGRLGAPYGCPAVTSVSAADYTASPPKARM